MSDRADVLLRVEGLTKAFSGVTALRKLSIEIYQGERLGVVGPNGSGKTTLFNVISGHYVPTSGTVTFHGRRIDGAPMHSIARMGLARTFQQAITFPALSVEENLAVAFSASRRSSDRDMDHILELCSLGSVRTELAGSLPHGSQRKLGVALALATKPELLLLDEPAAGLTEQEGNELAQLIRGITEEGVTSVVIDHGMPFIVPLVDRIVVLDAGEKLWEGAPQDMADQAEVRSAYLGQQDLFA